MICEQCGKRVYSITLPIDVQTPSGFVRKQVCSTCFENHHKELEQRRRNFQIQYGNK
jgi:protein-arginine kinase activator protein McsA